MSEALNRCDCNGSGPLLVPPENQLGAHNPHNCNAFAAQTNVTAVGGDMSEALNRCDCNGSGPLLVPPQGFEP